MPLGAIRSRLMSVQSRVGGGAACGSAWAFPHREEGYRSEERPASRDATGRRVVITPCIASGRARARCSMAPARPRDVFTVLNSSSLAPLTAAPPQRLRKGATGFTTRLDECARPEPCGRHLACRRAHCGCRAERLFRRITLLVRGAAGSSLAYRMNSLRKRSARVARGAARSRQHTTPNAFLCGRLDTARCTDFLTLTRWHSHAATRRSQTGF